MEHIDPTNLDPVVVQNATKVLVALAPLAREIVTDGYHALRDRLARRFAGQPAAERALAEYEENPDAGAEHLKQEIIRLGVAQDPETLAAAERILAVVDARQAVKSDIKVEFGTGAQGNVVGHNARATNYFGNQPQEKEQ